MAVAPPEAIAAARAALADTRRGTSLKVTLLTAGPGDAVWERFGHNLLWIRDVETGEGLAWNWGMFDFDQPGFVRRFLFGDTRYWIGGADVGLILRYYQQVNREIVAQDLALAPGQRAALEALVRVNAADANKYYRYDYFVDNCSTRLRDALDIVLGGALREALEARPVAETYRRETLRLVEHNPWLFFGMDLALGAPADAPLTEWQLAFIPMRLRDALREVHVRGAEGGPIRLVTSERILVPSTRPPELAVGAPGGRTRRAVVFVAIGLTVVLIALAAAARGGRRYALAPIAALGATLHGAAGILSVALLFMWFFTEHHFWGWNAHLLLFTPVSLFVAVELPGAVRRGDLPRWIDGYHFGMAALAFLLAVVTMVLAAGAGGGASGFQWWAHGAWVGYLGLGIASRGVGRAGERRPGAA